MATVKFHVEDTPRTDALTMDELEELSNEVAKQVGPAFMRGEMSGVATVMLKGEPIEQVWKVLEVNEHKDLVEKLRVER